MKKRTIIIPAILVIAAAVVGWRIVAARSDTLPTVPVATVSPEHLTREVIATGEILSAETETVTTVSSGRIERLSVAVGDVVRPGTIIATLEDDSIRLREQTATYGIESARRAVREQLMTLRSQYDDALDAARRSQESLARTDELHEIGSASDETLRAAREELGTRERSLAGVRERLNYREGRPLDDARTEPFLSDDEIIDGSIEVRQAEGTLDGIREELGGYTIRSRIGGTVTDVLADEGHLVGGGTPIATIHDQRALEVVSPIDEVDLGYVELGQPVRIDSDSFIGQTLVGSVREIAPIIRRVGDTRVCEVTIGFADPEHIARVGASCTVYVTVRDKPDAPAIPIQSYFLENGAKFVYVPVPATGADAPEEQAPDERDSGAEATYTLEKREVVTGIIGLDRVEVISGVEVGDRVVAAGVQNCHEGQRVLLATTEPVDDQAE